MHASCCAKRCITCWMYHSLGSYYRPLGTAKVKFTLRKEHHSSSNNQWKIETIYAAAGGLAAILENKCCLTQPSDWSRSLPRRSLESLRMMHQGNYHSLLPPAICPEEGIGIADKEHLLPAYKTTERSTFSCFHTHLSHWSLPLSFYWYPRHLPPQ